MPVLDQPAVASDHALIHAGQAFEVSYSASLANGASFNLLLVTPSNRTAHTRFIMAGPGQGTLRVFEAPTYSAAGTANAGVQRNRSKASTTPTVTVTHTPTTSADGTLLFTRSNGGSTGANSAGGATGPDQEWVLAAGTAYLIRVTNASGVAGTFAVELTFYEVPA